MLGLEAARAPAATMGLPVNLFDAMRVVLRKPNSDQVRIMSDRLSFAQIAILVAYAGAMTGGQLLFKMAALRAAPDGPFVERTMSLVAERLFSRRTGALSLLTVLWVWILTFTPLSRAYPFVALAFALTPALGGLLFAEPISLRLVIGIVLILCGLVFVAGMQLIAAGQSIGSSSPPTMRRR